MASNRKSTGTSTSKSQASSTLNQELASCSLSSSASSTVSSYSSACDDIPTIMPSEETAAETCLIPPSSAKDNMSVPGTSSSSIPHIKHQLTEETMMEEDEDEGPLVDRILPRELLLRVFSFLDVVSLCRAAQVSKAWNSLALDGSNWQSVDLFSFQTEINSPVIQRLSSRTGGFLHALSLRGCKSLTDDALKELAKSCPNLESLDLNDCKNLTDATCQSIASHCFHLKFLDLSGLSITDASLESLATSYSLSRRLNHLNISFCTRLTATGFLKLLAGPPDLLIQPLETNGDGGHVSNGHHAFQMSNNHWTNGSTTEDNKIFRRLSSSQLPPFYNLKFFAAKMVSLFQCL